MTRYEEVQNRLYEAQKKALLALLELEALKKAQLEMTVEEAEKEMGENK